MNPSTVVSRAMHAIFRYRQRVPEVREQKDNINAQKGIISFRVVVNLRVKNKIH
jgi:hypothetical protein